MKIETKYSNQQLCKFEEIQKRTREKRNWREKGDRQGI